MGGLRDLALIGALIVLVPTAIMRPWIGILGWCWISFMAPHMLTWGVGRRLPVALLVGGATLIGFVFTKDKKPVPSTVGIALLVIFGIHVTMTTLLAFDFSVAYVKWDWVIKSLLMTVVAIAVMQDRERVRWLLVVIALSLGFYGLKGGLYVVRSAGGYRVWGPEKTFFGDNTALGMALCMILPLLLYLSREEPRRWLRIFMRVVFFFSIIAIIFTYSRGAFLGLAVVMGVLVWRSPWRLRFAAAILVLAVVAVPLAPQRLWDRIDALIASVDEETRDTSVVGRLEAWQTGWNIAVTHPLTGGGFRAYWHEHVWKGYHEGQYLRGRDAHSLYFEVLGEQGFLGFGIYMSLLGWVLLTLSRLRRRWRRHEQHGYLSSYAEMIQLSLYPFLLSGAFIGMAYWDVYFMLVGITIVLHELSRRALAAMPARSRPALTSRALGLPALPPAPLPRRVTRASGGGA